ncbi:AraC family transcriptional regulator [Cryptosporangium minutisporangium]|uniref:HTH araC/xylS-type domain-containing protein n=1 Tax=Cryptosporangium minutisporangium TaxID=113569 RepID=A0ABP6SS19_9ACTN
MPELSITLREGHAHFTEGVLAAAGRHVHVARMEVHTHGFVEIAVVTGGGGTHLSLGGRHDIQVGDVFFLRPGVWHGYDCAHLELYNCGFSPELLYRELAWSHEDPLLGYLLWTAPLSKGRRGLLTTHLGAEQLRDCEAHLEALDRLRFKPLGLHRGDVIAELTLVLGHVARAVAADRDHAAEPSGPTHPVVAQAIQTLESRLQHPWTLTELAAELHVSSSYLLRRFKASTGLPPMAYLARRRVETAAEMLLHSDETVGEIGDAVGWPDPNYFARRFRTHFGLSATTYRARFAHTARQLRAVPP